MHTGLLALIDIYLIQDPTFTQEKKNVYFPNYKVSVQRNATYQMTLFFFFFYFERTKWPFLEV